MKSYLFIAVLHTRKVPQWSNIGQTIHNYQFILMAML